MKAKERAFPFNGVAVYRPEQQRMHDDRNATRLAAYQRKRLAHDAFNSYIAGHTFSGLLILPKMWPRFRSGIITSVFLAYSYRQGEGLSVLPAASLRGTTTRRELGKGITLMARLNYYAQAKYD